MKRIHLFPKISAFAFGVFCFLANIPVTNGQEISMRVLALPFENAEVSEPSAVVAIGDGTYLLVADDDSTDLLIVEAKNRTVRRKDLRIPNLSGSSPDWEGMAKDSQGNYYLIGSHRDSSSAHLLRFTLNEKETPAAKKEGKRLTSASYLLLGSGISIDTL